VVLLIVLSTPITHQLETSQDLAHGEETDQFCADDTNTNHLGGAQAAHAAESVAS